MNNETIKTIVPVECPHCHNTVIVEFSTTSPQVGSVYGVESIAEAKRDLKERVMALSIADDKKEQTLRWIDDEETIFGPSEVEEIIKNLLSQGN